nr:lipid A export permease/ATP-binding protein MsbA [Pseudomonadota bacterium]
MTTPASPLRERLRRIAPFFANSRRGFVIAFFGAVVGAATEPAIPALLKWLLDNGFQLGGVPLWIVPVAVIGLTVIRGGAGFVAQYGMSWAANRGVLELRGAMFARLLDAEPALFTRNMASNLINTLTFEVQNGATQLVYALQDLVRDSLVLVALVCYLLYLNWQLTLVVALLMPAVAFVVRFYGKRLHRFTVEGQKATDELAYVVEENVMAWRSVRLHAAGPAQATRFHAVSERLRRTSIKAVTAAATMTPMTQVIASIALATVMTVALWQSGHDKTTVGGFVAFVTGLLQLISPMKHLAEISAPITRGLAALERGVGLIDSTLPERGGSFDPGRAQGRIDIVDVTVAYRGEPPAALDAVTLHLEPGETVALVGPSGAGKTTIVNMLPRFIEPTSGTIRLDGVPLAEWNVEALRRQFALVSQDVSLFNDSVAANVALGATIDRQRVVDALRAANLLAFAEGLPNGIDSIVGHNASELSGGQRQRLAIARAIYKDAPILILDEATSALDSESERLVQQALETLMKGRTSLVIAHRLSTIEHADRIVTLEAGRVVDVRDPLPVVQPRDLAAARDRFVTVFADRGFPQRHRVRASARHERERGAVGRGDERFEQIVGFDEPARGLRRAGRRLDVDAIDGTSARVEQHDRAAARVDDPLAVGRRIAREILAFVGEALHAGAVGPHRVEVADPFVIGEEDRAFAVPHRPHEVAVQLARQPHEGALARRIDPQRACRSAPIALPARGIVVVAADQGRAVRRDVER